MNWILFALIAPFFWALSNIFDKYALNKLSQSISDFIFFGTIGNIMVFIIAYIFVGVDSIPSNLAIMAILGGALINYSYIFYAKALENKEASRIVPLFQTIPIFILVLGYVFFKELISSTQLFGFFVVFFGGVILTTEKNALKKFKIDKSFWLMITASVLIAVSTLFSDHVLESTRFRTLFIYDLMGFSIAGFSLMLYTPWRKEIWQAIKKAKIRKYLLFFLNDSFDTAGHIFFKFALITAPSAALVSVMLGIQPIYLLSLTILLTIFLPKIIKEDISWKSVYQKIAGILIIFVGVIIIVL